MAATELLFYGGGGHAKVIIESWIASGGAVAGVFDDNPALRDVLGHKVIGGYDASCLPAIGIVISIGNNGTRRTIAGAVKHPFGKVIHPSATISPSCQLGQGTVVMPGSIVSSSSVVGSHVIVNHKSCIDHDCIISDLVHLAPGSTVCGEVSIGEGTLIGAGATVLPGIRIGKWATIGAGSVVAQDVPDFAVSVGVPAKVMKYIENK